MNAVRLSLSSGFRAAALSRSCCMGLCADGDFTALRTVQAADQALHSVAFQRPTRPTSRALECVRNN